MSTAAVHFDKVTCTFAGKSGPYTAVKDVTLSIAEGEFVSVVGPTGCGKSTLLNVAAGLLLLVVAQVVIDHFSEQRATQYLAALP